MPGIGRLSVNSRMTGTVVKMISSDITPRNTSGMIDRQIIIMGLYRKMLF